VLLGRPRASDLPRHTVSPRTTRRSSLIMSIVAVALIDIPPRSAGGSVPSKSVGAAAGTELDRARELLDDGERVLAETGARGFLPELLYARARIHDAIGDNVGRRAALERGLKIANENQARVGRSDSRTRQRPGSNRADATRTGPRSGRTSNSRRRRYDCRRVHGRRQPDATGGRRGLASLVTARVRNRSATGHGRNPWGVIGAARPAEFREPVRDDHGLGGPPWCLGCVAGSELAVILGGDDAQNSQFPGMGRGAAVP
jgi:hypothetical protein